MRFIHHVRIRDSIDKWRAVLRKPRDAALKCDRYRTFIILDLPTLAAGGESGPSGCPLECQSNGGLKVEKENDDDRSIEEPHGCDDVWTVL